MIWLLGAGLGLGGFLVFDVGLLHIATRWLDDDVDVFS